MAQAGGARASQPEVKQADARGTQQADLDALLQLAGQHLGRQEYVKALKAYTRAVDLDPASEEACEGKVASLRRLGRPRGALKACEFALRSLPACQPLLDARAELTVQL